MKKWLCLCLCAGLTFGAVGCGNTTEPTEQTAQQTQEQETKEQDKEAPSFDFTVDDFVKMMDTELAKSEKKLLTENEVVAEETKTTFRISEYATISVTKNSDGNLGTILFTTNAMIDPDTLMYVDALIISAIFICDADMLTQIVEELNLENLEKGNYISLGKNGTYTFDVTDEKMTLLIFAN